MEEPSQKKPFFQQKVLWPLVTGYSILYLGLTIADFALRHKFTMPPGMMIIYIALVTAYAGNKEIQRWVGKSLPAKWGSLFVYAWFIFFAVAYTIKAIFPQYEIPSDLPKVCLQVLGIFFGSKASSKIYSMRQEAKDFKTKLKGREEKVLVLISEKGKTTRKDVAQFLEVSTSTAGRILQQMEDEGKIKQQGSGRGAYYI